MKLLPSFLQDTKHTLQIIVNINEKIDSGEFSVEGVALVTLDVDKIYNNMTEQLELTGCKIILKIERNRVYNEGTRNMHQKQFWSERVACDQLLS